MPLTAKNRNRGQIFLEVLITIVVLAILSHALFSLVVSTYDLISFTRTRITARHIAQEKMELIRNLPYDSIGTLRGIPSGTLAQNETIDRNGLIFHIKTDIVYIDDPFDKLAPLDLLPTDYKRVRVDVWWGGVAASETNPVTDITDIVPNGIEKTTSGGTLSILVFNSQGQPVPQASVTIVATATNPQVNLNLSTGDDGRIMLPGAPTCNGCYRITATKNGFSTDRTYSITEIANPSKPDISILKGKVSEISFAIDTQSTLALHSYQDSWNNFAPLPNQIFILRGEKILGTDVNDNPVYKFNNSFTTDGSGQITIPNIEWDNYHIQLPQGSSYDVFGTNPLLPVKVYAGQTYNAAVALTPHTANSLWVTFTDSAQNPLATVSAQIRDSDGFTASSSSGLSVNPNFGQVFFNNLSNKIYYLDASASGFQNFSGNVTVSGATQENVTLKSQ